MLIGKIVGSVVSTRKNEKLVGSKFMIVEALAKTGSCTRVVAVDNIGAGIGELVLVATGSAARIGTDCATSLRVHAGKNRCLLRRRAVLP